MRIYLESSSEKDMAEAAASISAISWEHVFDELTLARSTYEQKGTSSPVRRGFRNGAAIYRNLRPMLEAIPQDDGLGLIKGGLLLVLNVGSQPLYNSILGHSG